MANPLALIAAPPIPLVINISVSRRHLQRYVDEFCYRYNLRKADPFAAFDLTINRGLGVAA